MAEQLGGYQLGDVVETDTNTVTRSASRPGLSRPLLIKALKPGIERKPAVLQQLERELEALQMVEHPSLEAMVDVVHSDDGYVEALVLIDREGYRLDELLGKAGAIPAASAMAIGVQLADALGAIHRAGQVHGGLDTGDVEITPQGGVVIHGFARQFAARGGGGELDQPAAMAPEQLVGNAPEVTSDVFRLGAVLYRMLSGHSPFEGDDELSMAQRIRHEPAQPLARHMASAPSSVERLVGRCLSKRPRDRFPDTTSLAAELVRTLRTQTSLPLELLVSQALARAGVAEQLPAPEEQHVGEGTGLSQRLLGRGIAIAAVAAAAIVVALVAWQALRSPSAPGIIGARGVAQKPAELRVLARPWAEVHVDGNQVAITPIARPLPLGPGRHTVVFKHPNADDESREIEVIAGQTVLLDVQMKVRRPKVDAGPPDSGVIDP